MRLLSCFGVERRCDGDASFARSERRSRSDFSSIFGERLILHRTFLGVTLKMNGVRAVFICIMVFVIRIMQNWIMIFTYLFFIDNVYMQYIIFVEVEIDI